MTGLPGDRATAPVPLEDSSDQAWKEFLLLQSGHSSVADTMPSQLAAAGRDGARASREPISVVITMLLARHGNRTCPVTPRWAELHALLPVMNGQSAPAPLQD